LIDNIKQKGINDKLFKYHNRNSVGIAFRRLLDSLNLKGRYTSNDNRHTFITDLVTKVFDPKTIMEITGHKDIKMLIERYTHPGLDHKNKAVNSLDNLNPANKIVSIN